MGQREPRSQTNFQQIVWVDAFKLKDIPEDFKFYLYVPVVKTEHDDILRPYYFYVQMTTHDDKTIISWEFIIRFVSSRDLQNIRFKRVPFTRKQMLNMKSRYISTQNS